MALEFNIARFDKKALDISGKESAKMPGLTIENFHMDPTVAREYVRQGGSATS